MTLLNILIFSAVMSIEMFRIGAINDTGPQEEIYHSNQFFSSEKECAENSDCLDSELCAINKCAHACINQCLYPNELCFGRNHTDVCFCRPGFIYNSAGICDTPCIHSSDCNPLEECYKDEIIAGRCQCIHMYVRDHYKRRECELSRVCHNDNACQFFEKCVHGECINVCSKLNCTSPNQGCIAYQHRAACVCQDGYGVSPDKRCLKIDCFEDSDCGVDSVCAVIDNFPHCDCKLGYVPDYTDKGRCRRGCVYENHCDDGFWCNGMICLPCDNRMCAKKA